jgi:uncharacterized membrane protein
MIDGYARVLTVIAAAGAGLAAGFYFAFSSVVMIALDRLSPNEGVKAMQSINRAAPVPWVITCLGTAAVTFALAVVAFADLDETWAVYLLIGAAIYLASIVLTFAYHVPRNEALAALDPAGPGATNTWRTYLTQWTAWNHVRAATSLAAAVMFILALRVH